MESILLSSLLSDSVAEEQRKVQARAHRKSVGSDCAPQKLTEAIAVSVAELKLREQALRDREQALKNREERLESKWGGTNRIFHILWSAVQIYPETFGVLLGRQLKI